MDQVRIAASDEHVVGVVISGAGETIRITPRMVKSKAGAVIDRPQVLVPDEQVGVPATAVNVGDERVQPDHPCRIIRWYCERAVIADRSGQEVNGEVESSTGRQKALEL